MDKSTKTIIVTACLICTVVIVSIAVLVTSLTLGSDKQNNSASERTTVIRKCERCSNNATRSLVGTHFSDNNVHYLCDSCFNSIFK